MNNRDSINFSDLSVDSNDASSFNLHSNNNMSFSSMVNSSVEKTFNSLANGINLEKSANLSNRRNNKIDVSKAKHFNVKVVRKKQSFFKFILSVISYSLFIWLLLVGITLLIYVSDIKIREMKGDYSTPTYNAYVVLTGSMVPEIEVNDVVITKMVEPSTLKEGDIITFASSDSRFEGTIITHRIINTYCDDIICNFQTKGDANNVVDSALVQSPNIYGKVIFKIPKLGYLQKILASRGGWILIILVPCLIVVSYDIMKLFKKIILKKRNKIKIS